MKVPISKVIPSPINGKTVSFTKFIHTIVNYVPTTRANEGFIVEYRDVNVIFDEKEDREGMDKRFNEPNSPVWRVKHDVTIVKCTFDKAMWWVMNKMVFEGFFGISSCVDLKIILKNSTFEKTIRFERNDIGFLDFDQVDFKHGFRYHFNVIQDHLKFSNCKFSINPLIKDDTRFSGFDMYVIEPRLLEIHQKGEADLTIENTEFKVPFQFQNTAKGVIDISTSNFNNMALVGNKFECNINLTKTAIQNQFLLNDSYISGKIIIDAFNLNPTNTRIQWSSVADNKISVYDKNNKLINGVMRSQIKDEVVFNNLISCYANFYTVFKTQGNRMFANSCYVEWKNIETEYLRNTYKNKEVNVYFNYLMNLFLREFCDYGTNPLKSIYISVWVLISFGLVYFVSPFRVNYNKNENNTPTTIYGKLAMYARYFSEENSLKNIYSEHVPSGVPDNDAKKYADLIEVKKESLPAFFRWVAFPLAWWKNMKHRFILKFYDWIDQYPTHWYNFTKKQKVKAFFVFGTLIILDFLYFTVVRAVDSLTLSLNVFSTLGFGEVPVKGVIRYLTVIEGFVGWFLLSIFSVALISQIIQ
ncbi:hypothetical protein AD998_11550 [bacterium 336/3]|nr:hypothetical protein AD998_11550 [bacterium 336/3]